MTKDLKFTGKTVSEATEAALKFLEVNLEDIETTILSPGREGVLGLGGKLAEISVRLKSEEPLSDTPAPPKKSRKRTRQVFDDGSATAPEEDGELDDKTRKIATESLTYLLGAIGLESSVFLLENSTANQINFDITSDESGLLIGSYGSSLKALEVIIELILMKLIDRRVKISVDTENYNDRRKDVLRELVKRMVKKAKQTGAEQHFAPMSSHDRRKIHEYATQYSGVSTKSEGKGRMRHTVLRLE